MINLTLYKMRSKKQYKEHQMSRKALYLDD